MHFIVCIPTNTCTYIHTDKRARTHGRMHSHTHRHQMNQRRKAQGLNVNHQCEQVRAGWGLGRSGEGANPREAGRGIHPVGPQLWDAPLCLHRLHQPLNPRWECLCCRPHERDPKQTWQNRKQRRYATPPKRFNPPLTLPSTTAAQTVPYERCQSRAADIMRTSANKKWVFKFLITALFRSARIRNSTKTVCFAGAWVALLARPFSYQSPESPQREN